METLIKLTDLGYINIELLSILGQEFLKEKQYDDAIKCFQLILSEEKNSLESHRGLAMSYLGKEDYEKAIKENKEILKLYPEDLTAIEAIGKVFFDLSDYENSLIWNGKALNLNPDVETKRKLINMNFSSLVNLAQKDLEEKKFKVAEVKIL